MIRLGSSLRPILSQPAEQLAALREALPMDTPQSETEVDTAQAREEATATAACRTVLKGRLANPSPDREIAMVQTRLIKERCAACRRCS
jgi:hypothetical protein